MLTPSYLVTLPAHLPPCPRLALRPSRWRPCMYSASSCHPGPQALPARYTPITSLSWYSLPVVGHVRLRWSYFEYFINVYLAHPSTSTSTTFATIKGTHARTCTILCSTSARHVPLHASGTACAVPSMSTRWHTTRLGASCRSPCLSMQVLLTEHPSTARSHPGQLLQGPPLSTMRNQRPWFVREHTTNGKLLLCGSCPCCIIRAPHTKEISSVAPQPLSFSLSLTVHLHLLRPLHSSCSLLTNPPDTVFPIPLCHSLNLLLILQSLQDTLQLLRLHPKTTHCPE